MLPASTFAEIATNIAALRLESNTAAQILAAVFAPLLRGSDCDPDPEIHKQRPDRPGPKPRRVPRRKREKFEPRAKANGAGPTDSPRQRAIAALKANPDLSPTEIAKATGCSRGTVLNAARDLAAEAHNKARKASKAAAKLVRSAAPPITERRQRAQQFLKEALAHGAKPVSEVEHAAEKAHIDPHTLGQARAELGVVTSRSNAGGVQAVQWSLPG